MSKWVDIGQTDRQMSKQEETQNQTRGITARRCTRQRRGRQIDVNSVPQEGTQREEDRREGGVIEKQERPSRSDI